MLLAIAKELGGRTADEYAAVMSESEFWEWAEFYKIRNEEQERQRKKNTPSGRRGRGSRGRR